MKRTALFCVLTGCLSAIAHAQPDTATSLTLEQCIAYGLQHKPALNQALLNIKIARTTNAINLAGWLPQVNLSANMTHYDQLPTTFIANSDSASGPPRRSTTGVVNTAIPTLGISQAIFNPQLLYAANSAPLYVQQARDVKDSTDINIVWTVSKAYYNLLLTLKQINVLKEDTARLNRNVQDTYHQFVGGIVDETDYDEAVISLNNSMAQLKQQVETVAPQYALLKEAIGYPAEKQFNVVFDSTRMLQQIYFDTTEQLQYDKRIEYRQLSTIKKLQHSLTHYYDLAFLPTASVFYNYYYEYENNNLSSLFNTAYPYSYVGLSVNIPLFTGMSRVENIHKSKLQEQTIDWSEVALKSQIYSEYTAALASYKSNLYNYKMLRENITRAQNVYRIVSLQYKQGVVAYLNMIVAESNLIAAETGYVTALFQLLSSKLDLEKSLGDITPANH